MVQMAETHTKPLTRWRQWLEHPERLLIRRIVFQVHLWVGAMAAAYLLLMSASGSAIVFRNELGGNSLIEWLVRLHTNLLTGTTGRFVNGIGGGCLTLLCLTGAMIWWPGTRHWRRSLTVDWSAISRGSTGIFIARSASGCFLLCSSGEFPESISLSRILLTFYISLIRGTICELCTRLAIQLALRPVRVVHPDSLGAFRIGSRHPCLYRCVDLLPPGDL
jgi:hypothetical protein